MQSVDHPRLSIRTIIDDHVQETREIRHSERVEQHGEWIDQRWYRWF
jgi:hypothetical protein